MENASKLDLGSFVQFSLSGLDMELVVPMSVLAGLFVEGYEVLESQMIQQMYGDHLDDVVLEAGGGIGFTALLIARRRISRLVVFEAQPVFYEVVVHNLELNRAVGVTTRKAALGVSSGTAEFAVRYLPYASSLGDRPSRDTIREVVMVEVVGINEAVAEYGINALHLDIEGSEVDVLTAIDFAPIRKVVVEMHPHVLGRKTCASLIKRLVDVGLEPCFISGIDTYPDKCYVLAFARKGVVEALRAKGSYGSVQVITGWEFREGGEDVASTAVD